MPTYTYKCSACGNVFDLNASIQEKEEGKGKKFACPKCKSKNIKQEFSTANFIKNVFKKETHADGCCSGSNVCDTDCVPNEKESDCCGFNNTNCCG